MQLDTLMQVYLIIKAVSASPYTEATVYTSTYH